MPKHSALTGADLHAPQAHAASHEDGGSDEINDLGQLTAELEIKMSAPAVRLNDTGASGEEYRIVSDAGVVSIEVNENTEASPSWAAIITFDTSYDAILAGDLGVVGKIRGRDGSNTLPAYAFTSDPNTGMYRAAGDTIGFATGGTLRLQVASAGITIVNDLSVGGVLLNAAGSKAAPAYSFTGDPNTGIYSLAADTLGIAVGGADVGKFDQYGLYLFLAGTASALLTSDGGSGIYVRNAAHSAYGAVTAASFDATVSDALTDTPGTGLILRHSTSGAAAAGFGARITVSLEDDGGAMNTAAYMDIIWTDPSAGSEDADFVIKLMEGGAAAAERFRVASTGNITATGTVACAAMYPVVSDAGTSDVNIIISATRESSGTPAAGFGLSYNVVLHNAANVNKAASYVDTIWTDPSAGSEDADWVLKLMAGGAAAAEAFRVTSNGSIQIQGAINHDGNTIGFFATAPAAQAAAYTPTNVTPDRSYDADTVGVAELADIVGTLIADLQTYGLLQ